MRLGFFWGACSARDKAARNSYVATIMQLQLPLSVTYIYIKNILLKSSVQLNDVNIKIKNIIYLLTCVYSNHIDSSKFQVLHSAFSSGLF